MWYLKVDHTTNWPNAIQMLYFKMGDKTLYILAYSTRAVLHSSYMSLGNRTGNLPTAETETEKKRS